MAISVVSSAGYTESGTAGTTHSLSGLTMAAGNGRLVAIACHGGASSVSSVTDGVGATYRRCGQGVSTTTVSVELWATTAASPAALSANSVQVTTASAMGVAFRVYELSGVLMPLTNTFNTNQSNSGTGTSVTSLAGSSSIFTTDLAFAAVGTDGSATASSSSFTAGAATATNTDSSTTTGSVVQLVTAYLLMSATTAQTYTVTLGTSRTWADVNTRFLASGFTYTVTERLVLPAIPARTVGVAESPGIVVSITGQFIPPPTEIDRVT